MTITTSLADAPLGPTLLRLSVPSMIAMAVQTGVTVAEAHYVGRLGTAALAGLALVFPVFMLMTTLSNGAFGGTVAGTVARALGAGDRTLAGRVAGNAVLLAVAISATLSVVFLVAGPTLYAWAGGRGAVLGHALDYSNVLFAGVGALWLFNVLGSVARGAGRMRLAAAVMVGAACLQIPLAGALILGWAGLPSQGIAGAALAAIICYGLGAVVLAAALAAPRSMVRLSRSGLAPSVPLLARMLRIAGVAALSPITMVLGVVLLTRFVGQFGEAALAGYGIGTRLEFLIIPLVFGIGTALIAVVGANVGAGRLDAALRAAWLGAGAAALLAGAVGTFFAWHPLMWASLFSADPAVLESASAYLRVAGPGFAFLGLGLALYFASQGAGKVGWVVGATVVRVGTIFAGGTLVAHSSGATLTALYGVILAAMIAYGVITVAAVAAGAWRPRPVATQIGVG
jgi:putative MATE family efflux protein